MEKPESVRMFVVPNGEGYLFRALDYGGLGAKIELYDPRDIDIQDKDRLHAVILSPRKARELFMWIGKL